MAKEFKGSWKSDSALRTDFHRSGDAAFSGFVMDTVVPPLVVPLAGETPVTETEDDDGGAVMVPVPLSAMPCGCREEAR